MCMSNSTIQKTPTETGKSQSSFTQQRNPNTRSSFQGQKRNGTSKVGRGKSRYANKARSNFKKAPVAAKPKGPVNTYTSVCCGVPATKKACVAVSKKDALTQTLGKFRCSACKKRCKVTVSKYKAPETVFSPSGAQVTFGTVDGADMGRGTGFLPTAEVPVVS